MCTNIADAISAAASDDRDEVGIRAYTNHARIRGLPTTTKIKSATLAFCWTAICPHFIDRMCQKHASLQLYTSPARRQLKFYDAFMSHQTTTPLIVRPHDTQSIVHIVLVRSDISGAGVGPAIVFMGMT